MSSVIDSIERRQRREGLPPFDPGDRVRVHFRVIEGSRERVQVFEGIVLKRQGKGSRATFTVRKQSFGVGVERTFPLHSPKIERLEVAARGDVRRAKLYYLRGRIGKAARVAERRWGIDEEMISAPVAGDAEEPQAVDAEGVTVEEAVAEETPPEVAEEGEGEGAEPEAEEKAEEPQAEERPEAEAEAETDAEAPEAGEIEESAGAGDAEDESPSGDEGDSGEEQT